jgi:hypothetical protein
MRILRLLALLIPIVMLMLSACSPEDPFVATRKPTPRDTIQNAAFLRVIHASATAPATDVLVDGEAFFPKALEYLRFETGVNEAVYYPIDTTSGRLSFSSGGEIAGSDLNLRLGKYYTAYLYGTRNDYRVLITTDTILPKPDLVTTRYRVVHLAPGSPTVDLTIGEPNDPPSLTNIAYGTATEYTMRTAPPYDPGLYVFDNTTKEQLFGVPGVLIVTASVQTIIMTGSIDPRGDDPILSFSVFQESAQTSQTGLYGALPFRLSLASIRFANLVPSGDTTLSVSFLDSINEPKFAPNEYFRRNYRGQEWVLSVPPLGYSAAIGLQPMRPSFLLSTFLKIWYPYRIEMSTQPQYSFDQQPSLVPETQGLAIPFTIDPNRRYTIIAYGPFAPGDAESKVLQDNAPAPSSQAMAAIRFFHGGFGDLLNKKLSVRINGVASPLMSYGQLPGNSDVFEVPAGATSIELLDESGTVIHTETLVDPVPMLEGGENYTVFLSRGARGNHTIITPVSDRLRLN